MGFDGRDKNERPENIWVSKLVMLKNYVLEIWCNNWP